MTLADADRDFIEPVIEDAPRLIREKIVEMVGGERTSASAIVSALTRVGAL